MAIGTYVEPENPRRPRRKRRPQKLVILILVIRQLVEGAAVRRPRPAAGSSDADLDGSKGMKMQLTAYCSYCNSGSKTSSGTYPAAGRTVACNSLPLGTRIYIEGYGEYIVEDRGGMGGNVIDIYMGEQENDDVCNSFGRKKKNVTVYVIG